MLVNAWRGTAAGGGSSADFRDRADGASSCAVRSDVGYDRACAGLATAPSSR